MKRLLFLIPLLLTCCEKKSEPPVKKPPAVTVAKAESKNTPYVVRTIGNTEAYKSVQITPQVTGELTGYYFIDGQDVNEGTLLFTIDPRSYQAQLEEARGQLKQAEGSLQYNKQRLMRYKTLLPDDFVSKLTYEEYISAVNESAGQVKEFEGSVAKAKVNLDYCQITSPISGRLGRRLIDPGNVVHAEQQDSLLVINQISPLYVLFTVPERDFLEIQKYNSQGKLKVKVQVPGQQTEREGVLDFVDNTVDVQTGTLQLRAKLQNADKILWPGQFVNVTVTLFEIDNAVMIPESAVSIDTKGAFVFVTTKEQTVEKRSVTVGQRFGTNVVIKKGVKADETVVTGGQLALQSGSKYRIQESK